jgi:hypothetical protein
MGALVPLQVDPDNADRFSNIPAFVDSLFDPDVRTLAPAQAAVDAGDANFLYCDDNSASLILQSWLAAWQASVGDNYDAHAYNRCPSGDRTVIAFLASYIKSHSLSMAVPDLDATNNYYTIDGHSLRQFNNNGYSWRPFLDNNGHWNYGEIYSSDPLRLSNGSYSTPSCRSSTTSCAARISWWPRPTATSPTATASALSSTPSWTPAPASRRSPATTPTTST